MIVAVELNRRLSSVLLAVCCLESLAGPLSLLMTLLLFQVGVLVLLRRLCPLFVMILDSVS